MTAQVDQDMKEILEDGLFIGNREDAFACLTQDSDITHILTIEAEPLASTDKYDKGDQNIVLKHINCLDQLEADLLSNLGECIDFIQDGLMNGRVLVHCSAGISRSATVILSYLMYSQNISLNQALQDLKAVYQKAEPNPGFMFQLYLFEAMGKKLDKSHSLYKQYNLQIIAKQVQKTGYREFPEDMLKGTVADQTVDLKRKNYKCKKCRQKLFYGENRIEHVPGTGEEFLSWNEKLTEKKRNSSQCTSYFVEPLPWMTSLLVGTVEGKLCCPKCSGRVGSFNWAGEQCSCGRWITPGFQLHKSRIDES